MVNLLIWMKVIGFMLLLGTGEIFKRFEVISVIGSIAAYWILGDVTDAIIPMVILIVVLVVSKIVRMRKSKKSSSKGRMP